MRRFYLDDFRSRFRRSRLFGSDGQRIPPHRPPPLLSKLSLHTHPRVDIQTLSPFGCLVKQPSLDPILVQTVWNFSHHDVFSLDALSLSVSSDVGIPYHRCSPPSSLIRGTQLHPTTLNRERDPCNSSTHVSAQLSKHQFRYGTTTETKVVISLSILFLQVKIHSFVQMTLREMGNRDRLDSGRFTITIYGAWVRYSFLSIIFPPHQTGIYSVDLPPSLGNSN